MSVPATPSTPNTTTSITSAPTQLVLSNLTADIGDFVVQFQQYLSTIASWRGFLTTTTAETLIELVSSVGAFAQGRIIRAAQDAFSSTALSNSAILAITQMQGLRITRYLPAGLTVTLNSAVDVALPPLTQFSCGGYNFFNRDALTIIGGTPLNCTLFEGQVFAYSLYGLGTERQTFVSVQDGFAVSDQDTYVLLNGTIIPKQFGNLWENDGVPGYVDMTTSDGRLLLVFGNYGGDNGSFGTIPGTTDTIVIAYPVTQGASINGVPLTNKTVQVTGFSQISGFATANPTGGANDKPVLAYKNLSAGGFGAYSSAVTKSQYNAMIGLYPGIVDAICQAQREINPGDVRWMNVIRISALTTSPWTQQQITDYLTYCQKTTMFAGYFLWQAPIAVPQDVALNVYIFNSALPDTVKQSSINAITNLLTPRPGILMTNFYIDDYVQAVRKASPGAISYIQAQSPTADAVISAPPSPQLSFTINAAGSGSLAELSYGYSVQTTDTAGLSGTPDTWVFPAITDSAGYSITLNWNAVPNAQTYTVWGRVPGVNTLGVLATLPATTLTWTDNGSVSPNTANPMPTVANIPIRYSSLNSVTINVYYANRQQQIMGSNGYEPVRLSGG